MKLLIFCIVIILLLGCKGQTTSTSPTTLFDPASPGSGGSSTRIPSVLSLSMIDNGNNTRTLNYTIPSTYLGQEYSIYIYRTVGTTAEFVLSDPAETYNTAYLYPVSQTFTPITVNTYTDTTPLISNSTYTYWVYVNINKQWSLGSTKTFTTPSLSTQIIIPTPSTFWSKYTNFYGLAQTNNTVGLVTLGAGTPTFNSPTGGIAFEPNGGLMYVADTNNNRVMIYISQSYQSCLIYTPGTADYTICQAVYFGYPLQAVAVLGQADFSSTFPCGDPANTLTQDQCMTKPRSVTVANGQLIVSDSGNDRLLVYPILPTFGCYHFLNMTGITTANECAPYKVVGKQTLLDTATYPINDPLAPDNGKSTLSNPTGTTYSNGNLYIADTGNHRVVSVSDFFNIEANNCSAGSWKTTKCSFASVLGQKDLFSKIEINNVYNNPANPVYQAPVNPLSYNIAIHKLMEGGLPSTFLQTHFANPTKVKVNNGQLFIVSDENFTDNRSTPSYNIYGRISVFNTDPLSGANPICNSTNWGGVASCGSSYEIGQIAPDTLIELPLNANYSDIPYSFKSVDIDFVGNYLVAIDKDQNHVYLWSSILNTNDGIPYTRVINPAGAFDSTSNRFLPNLKQLTSIAAVSSMADLYIFDATNGTIYEIPFK